MRKDTRVEKNFRYCLIAEFCSGFQVLAPIWTLFCYSRSLEPSHMFWLLFSFCFAILIFEIPTGFFADRFGPRLSFIIGCLIQIFAISLLFFASSLWQFMMIQFLIGLSETFFSGAMEAVVYESLKVQSKEHLSTKYFGRIYSANLIAILVANIFGAWFAQDLAEDKFKILIMIYLIFSFIRLISVSFIVNPLKELHYRDIPLMSGVADSFKVIKNNPSLIYGFLNITIVFIPTYIFQQFQQPALLESGMQTKYLGLIFAFIGISGFLLSLKSGSIANRFKAKHIILITGIILTVGYLLSFFFIDSRLMLILSVFLIGIPMSLRWPLYSTLQNQWIPSVGRATTISMLSIFDSMLDLLFLIGFGLITTFEYSHLFLACFFISLFGLCFPFRLKKEHVSRK